MPTIPLCFSTAFLSDLRFVSARGEALTLRLAPSRDEACIVSKHQLIWRKGSTVKKPCFVLEPGDAPLVVSLEEGVDLIRRRLEYYDSDLSPRISPRSRPTR